MIGRGAIRNPWLFHQIRQHQRGETAVRAARPRCARIHRARSTKPSARPTCRRPSQVQKMKKF